MDRDRLQRVEAVFHDARALEPADRADFLDRACGDDLDLRGEVESLLTHAEGGTAGVRLRPDGADGTAGTGAAPVGATLVDRGPLHEGPGTRIGPYKILQQIGEGGFGSVYMAEQERPVQRKVALKVIKLGMDTKQVIARFEAERQALALMDHPNIARVLDAGATETGRPYFVMELVRGISITEYCDKNRMSTGERLRLFIDVCRAIQHAHQKGIIHRDLKPSNVLVTLHDSRPVPKVIDFGIAKATSHRLTEKTLFTEFRQFIGTPEYMSPDQAEISGLDVDTRTDIYSLGVLLYELITGTTPLDPETLRGAGYAQMQKMILEEEPPKPSTRLSGRGDELTDLARHRQVEPSSLSRSVRGDLDWIIMKAMEKDRTRRYQTASELADDIERHLGNLPVLAGPPSTVYRVRKFIRRHRVGVTVSALAVALVIIALPVSLYGYVSAAMQAHRSQEITSFLQEQLIAVDPQQAQHMDVSVEQVLEQSRELFGDDHAVVAGVLYSWAANLRAVGRPEEAAPVLETALELYRAAYGEDHASVGVALGALSEVSADVGKLGDAERFGREALELQRSRFGEGSLQVAEALDRLNGCLTKSAVGDRNDEIAELWAETLAAYRAAVGDDDPRTVKQLCGFGAWLFHRGRFAEAGPLLEEAAERSARVLQQGDSTYVEAMVALVNLRASQGDVDVTSNKFDQLLAAIEATYGTENPVVVMVRANYGQFLLNLAQLERAEPVLIEAVAMAERMLKPGDQARLAALDGLTKVYVNLDDVEKAAPLYGQVIDEGRLAWGTESPQLARSLVGYGRWLHTNHVDDEKAERVLREALSVAEAIFPEPDVAMLLGRERLIRILQEKPGDHGQEIREHFLTLIDEGKRAEGMPPNQSEKALDDGAAWLLDNGYPEEAEPMLVELVALRREAASQSAGLATALLRLGRARTQLGRASEGEPNLVECLTMRRTLYDDGHWVVGNAMSVLGECLAAQDRYDEAEPHLLDGYQLLRDHPQTPTARVQEGLERIVSLYETWGRPDDAARWRGS